MLKRGRINEKRGSRFFIKDRKGLELTIGTIVIIVLAVLVLIALIVIFNQQVLQFSDFLRNLVGKTNVDAVVASCNALTSQNSVYDFCCVEREVRYNEGGGIREEELTCSELADKSFAGERVGKLNCEGAGC